MHIVEKWSNMLETFCGVNAARFVKYIWPFINIIHEKVNKKLYWALPNVFHGLHDYIQIMIEYFETREYVQSELHWYDKRTSNTLLENKRSERFILTMEL